MTRALVLFAGGFEEIETVTILDVLRRAGVDVVAAALSRAPVRGAHGIQLVPDRAAGEVVAREFDCVVLPGGMENARTLASDPTCQRLIREARASDKVVGAICAAPVALHAAGLLQGFAHTSHPSVRAELPQDGYREQRVVQDRNLVTSRGPGTALEFALALVEALAGAERAREVAAPMLVAASA